MEELSSRSLRVAFLHIAPRFDNLTDNLDLLERMIRRAADHHPDLVLTPELAVSGYAFHASIGADWIQDDMPVVLERFGRLCEELRIALLLGTPVYDPNSGKLFNAAILIAETGLVAGRHHKILVLPGSIEGWSTPGSQALPVAWRGYPLGLMICADAYSARLAGELAQNGAQVLLSLAAWAPGEHAPSGEWEQRSLETGLPVLVCNRTGRDLSMNFEGSSSVVVTGGRRVAEYKETSPAILLMDFNERWQPLNPDFTVCTIESEK